MTRLVGQHRATGRVTDRRGGAPVRPFERRYTGADIRLLAEADAALGDMSGPATRAVMRREFEVFGQRRFERLARLSSGHLYNGVGPFQRTVHVLGYRQLGPPPRPPVQCAAPESRTRTRRDAS